jgi:hypothetical protein
MTPLEFRELLQANTDLQLLDPCLRDDQPPFVFDPAPASWDRFRDELVSNLGVSRSDIRVVGSGRFGFSMKPGRNLSEFRDNSDIDLLIVNSALFDNLWLALLSAAYPRPPIIQKASGWLSKRRNELYTGWLTPLEIKLDTKIYGSKARPVLDFRTGWFNALKLASRYVARRHEDVTGRLYRSWDHADLYHLHSLGALRRTLLIEDHS